MCYKPKYIFKHRKMIVSVTGHNNKIKINMTLTDIEEDPIYPDSINSHFDEKHDCLILSLDDNC